MTLHVIVKKIYVYVNSIFGRTKYYCFIINLACGLTVCFCIVSAALGGLAETDSVCNVSLGFNWTGEVHHDIVAMCLPHLYKSVKYLPLPFSLICLLHLDVLSLSTSPPNPS